MFGNNRTLNVNNLDTPDPIPNKQPTEYNAAAPRSGSSLKSWLTLFGGVLVFVGILGFALVQFLQGLYEAEQWFRTLVQGSIAVLLVAVVVALGWSAFSIGLAFHNRARRESLTYLPGNVPMPVGALQGATAESLAGRFLDVKLEEARHSGMRNVTTLSPSQSIHYGGASKTEQTATPEIAAPALEATAPDEWLQWIDRTPHVLLAAETGGGKSTTAKAILAPRIEAGEVAYIIDPHSSDWLGLPSVGGGENWSDVQMGMDAVFDEYQRRLDEREAHKKQTGLELPVSHFGRLTVLLDEANTTKANIDTGSKKVSNPWRRFVQVLGSGARKVNISVLLLAQSANVEDIGLSAPMRENFTRIALDSGAARKLITQEEPDSQRRQLLFAALADRQYPAVCEYRGRVYLLDRTGLDKVSTPANAQKAIWNGFDAGLLSKLLGETAGNNVVENVNGVSGNVSAEESDVSTVSTVHISEAERAEIAFLLATFPPSEATKRLTGYNSRKYGEYRAKVDAVAAELAEGRAEV